MATITSLGVGSGLDLESLVTSLMAVESRPLTALQTKAASYTSKISALGTLKSKLSALQTAAAAMRTTIGKTALTTFASYSASVADTTIASATAATGAVAGSYTLEVEQLARAQRFVSGTSFSSTTEAIGNEGDTLTFDFATPDAEGNSRSVTITLNSSNNSLTGLRNAINSANMGVTATIVNGTVDGEIKPQLIFTGSEGLDNEITLGGELATQFSQTVSAQNAKFSINGIAATSSTNAASGILDGVTINLAKQGTTTLTVAAEYSTNMTSALNAFITAYNSANSTMTTMGAYDATTKTAGALQGNQVLRDSQTTVRSLLYSTTVGGTSAYQTLSDIGVTAGTDGSLTLNSSKLESALAADPNAVASLVAKIGESYNTELEKTVGYTGRIKTATDSANAIVKDLQARQEALALRLETIETRYRAKFSALDTLISNLNTTSSYLTQQIASLTQSSESS